LLKSNVRVTHFRIFAELILRDDSASDHESKLPSLTHDQRSAWAKNRERFFLKHSSNREMLEVIESAMFVIILDDADDYDYDPVSSCLPLERSCQ
jgi:hypothetical protein